MTVICQVKNTAVGSTTYKPYWTHKPLLPQGLYWAGEGLPEENLFLVWMRGWVCNMWQLKHGSSWLNMCPVYLNMTMCSVERLIQWTFIEHTQWRKPAFVAYTVIWSSLGLASCVQIVQGSPFLSSTKLSCWSGFFWEKLEYNFSHDLCSYWWKCFKRARRMIDGHMITV